MAMWGAVKVTASAWTSTGIMRIDFQRPRGLVKEADYDIFCQPLTSGQSCVVTGTYSTYFTVEVRNSTGVLENLGFSFMMVGDNY
ncbi:MAG: hypothetical protein VB024_10710 [Dysgonamonadaceae bacterium]|nr:hypothetical protein [Dysgonamonadaceae bacterium]